MTTKDIRKYIDRLNQNKACETIFTRQINSCVDFAKVWEARPRMEDKIYSNFTSFRFFFIKNQFGEYIGAVLDMYHDLHWYIIPKFRKSGHLSKALKSTILPFLFSEGRDIQKITIEIGSIGKTNYLASKGVAVRLGFQAINDDETEFELKASDCNWLDGKLDGVNSTISPERFEILRRRVFYAHKLLLRTSDELLMALNDDKELEDLATEVRQFTWSIEDLEWEIAHKTS